MKCLSTILCVATLYVAFVMDEYAPGRIRLLGILLIFLIAALIEGA